MSPYLSILLLALCWFFPPGPAHGDPVRGKILFKEKKCLLCHDIALPGTEFKPMCPGLQGVSARHSREWTARWLKNPAAVWRTGDADVQDIDARYFNFRGSKPKPRESFMATVIGKQVILSGDEIEDLLDYLWTL
ncbi:MAG: cytochrome c [Nitrospinae bacterium]|nr:cytochrome c [Nitrospinota bacterium]